MKQFVEDRVSLRDQACLRTATPRVGQIETPAAEPERVEGQRQKVGQHALIYLEGDPADRIFQIVDGAVMLYKLLPDGRRQVVELLGPGDFFGVSTNSMHNASAETLMPVLMTVFDRHAVERSATFLTRLNRCLQGQLCALQDHAVLLGRKSALERVASFLLRFVPHRGGFACAGRAANGDTALVRLAMTRQEIADYLGLTIETVSRAFSELRRRGAVTLEKQDEVRIADVCGLCRLTGAH